MASSNSRFCELGGCIPKDPASMPSHPAERGLYTLGVGCNQLRCSACESPVVYRDGAYSCGCRTERFESTTYVQRQDHGAFAPPPVPWSCGGHPPPSDLASFGFTSDVLADVEAALVARPTPAHRARGHAGYQADLRLDLAGSFDAAAVRAVLVSALDGVDDLATFRAMDVLHHRGWIPVEGAEFRSQRLHQRPSPRFPTVMMGKAWDRYVKAARRG